MSQERSQKVDLTKKLHGLQEQQNNKGEGGLTPRAPLMSAARKIAPKPQAGIGKTPQNRMVVVGNRRMSNMTIPFTAPELPSAGMAEALGLEKLLYLGSPALGFRVEVDDNPPR
jgi:hypothetical protein